MFSVEERIRPDPPLRDLQRRADRLLAALPARFDAAYRRTGRPGVPPGRLRKALLLTALDSVRSERQLCERVDTDRSFRWFLDLQPGDPAFGATTFPRNRRRLDEHDLTETFFAAVVREALAAGLCSEPFSVDGTPTERFASAKSFQPKGSGDAPKDAHGFRPRNPAVDSHGRKRTNEAHRSRTDAEARLYRKGPGEEAKLAHRGHASGENRPGPVMALTVTEANGTAGRAAAFALPDELPAARGVRPGTSGADKGYAGGPFFQDREARRVGLPVPLSKPPQDPAGERHRERRRGAEARQRMQARGQTEGSRLSQKCRKKMEEVFGWLKGVAGRGRGRVVGRGKLQQLREAGAAADNPVRLRRLKPA